MIRARENFRDCEDRTDRLEESCGELLAVVRGDTLRRAVLEYPVFRDCDCNRVRSDRAQGHDLS